MIDPALKDKHIVVGVAAGVLTFLIDDGGLLLFHAPDGHVADMPENEVTDWDPPRLLGYTWAKPDIEGRDVIDARSLIGSVAVSYPFVRRQASTLRGTARSMKQSERFLRAFMTPFSRSGVMT